MINVIVIDDGNDQISNLSEIIEVLGQKVIGVGNNRDKAVKLFERHILT